MTLISNDPSWWPIIDIARFYSYSVVASYVVMLYDWVLTSGQEFELVWTRRWSLITVLYLSVRCLGVLSCGTNIMGMFSRKHCVRRSDRWNAANIPSVSVTDAGCTIVWLVGNWMAVVTSIILGAVMTIRLHAMYQGSRKMLIFLVIAYLANMIAAGVTLAIESHDIRGEEVIISGNHYCEHNYLDGNVPLLIGRNWIFVFGLAWEVLALCLAVWIVIKHYRELQRQSIRWSVRDCFAVLIKTHVFYFGALAVISCLAFGTPSPNMSNISILGYKIYNGVNQIASAMGLFVLGPRLILGVRAHHAQLLANSDEGTAMTTIVFQERISESTDSDV